MPPKPCIKLSLGILDDAQIALLPDELWRALVEPFLLAGWQDEDGTLPDVAYMAWRMHRPEDGLLELLLKLEKARLPCRSERGGWVVVDFGLDVSAGPLYQSQPCGGWMYGRFTGKIRFSSSSKCRANV